MGCRADRKIKHCRIKLEGRLYTIGNVEFESLVQLINYYQTHPLYKRVRLGHPCVYTMANKKQTSKVVN